MYRNILVPLDGSDFAEHALPWALGAIGRKDAELHLALIHQLDLPMDTGWLAQPDGFARSMHESEEGYLRETRRRLGEAGLDGVVVHHETGKAARRIIELAADHDIDLIVMSTHGRGGLQRAYLGSVADSVVRRSPVPALLVRPDEDEAPADLRPRKARRVLVALDGSRIAEAGLAAATELAAAEGASCTAMRVVVPPMFVTSYPPDTVRLTGEEIEVASAQAQKYLDRLERRVPAVDDTRLTVHPNPALAILKTAEEIGADLIAVGTRGLGGAARLLIGSVADKVVRGAHVPVLVVPRRPRAR